MTRAIELAASVPTATPNPRVGCVIESGGEIVGEGWHEGAGQPHAEVMALRDAGQRARGATVYVSLEPCCHSGRTPPCTGALIEAGVAEVVFAMRDPDPRVAGQGLERLRQAGIRIRGPLQEESAVALNRGFIKRMTAGLPWLRGKLAMSLDGRTAMADGESQWITGPAARADVQWLRAGSCAIMTGVNTVIRDDPRMTVRSGQLDHPDADRVARRQPERVILDSALRTPPQARILRQQGETLIFSGPDQKGLPEAFSGLAVTQHALPVDEQGRLRLLDALKFLAAERAYNEIMLEAGPTLSGAAVQAGLMDELVIYIGARFLGHEGLPLLRLPGMERMSDHVPLRITDMQRIGDDCRITVRPSEPERER